GLDHAPFFQLIANVQVVKVFHAARQEVEIVFHLGGLIPSPMFVTQVAGLVFGFGDAISYDQLVQNVSGNQIDKSSRLTGWRWRRLSAKQLDYALADVTHLRDIYLYLKEKLDAEGRNEWVNEEMAVLGARETYDLHPDDAWRRVKARVRKPIELAIVK